MCYAHTVRSLLIWWVLNPVFFQSWFSECGIKSRRFPSCEFVLGCVPVGSPSGCGGFPEGPGALSWPESPQVLQVEGNHYSVPRGDLWRPPLTCPVCNIYVPTASGPRTVVWLHPRSREPLTGVLQPPGVRADGQPCPPLPLRGRASSWSPSSRQPLKQTVSPSSRLTSQVACCGRAQPVSRRQAFIRRNICLQQEPALVWDAAVASPALWVFSYVCIPSLGNRPQGFGQVFRLNRN